MLKKLNWHETVFSGRCLEDHSHAQHCNIFKKLKTCMSNPMGIHLIIVLKTLSNYQYTTNIRSHTLLEQAGIELSHKKPCTWHIEANLFLAHAWLKQHDLMLCWGWWVSESHIKIIYTASCDRIPSLHAVQSDNLGVVAPSDCTTNVQSHTWLGLVGAQPSQIKPVTWLPVTRFSGMCGIN